MADDDECIHGMPKDLVCTICRDGPARDKSQPVIERVQAKFVAAFDGECRDCGFAIIPGQIIAKLEPTDRYVHWDCVP